MNRPRRPTQMPPRRRPSGPPPSDGGQGGPPRRRSPLDVVPQTTEPKFKVLGTGVDRQTIMSGAQPMELVVAQGYTREIEDAYHKFNGRPEDFWTRNPKMLEPAHKLDEVLAHIQARLKIR